MTCGIDRRHSRHQDTPRLGFVARQRERELQHITGWKHAELVAKLPGAAATVEHRDDRVKAEPWIVLQTAEQAGQAGASAKTADVQLPHFHRKDSIRLPLTVGRLPSR